MAFYKSGSYAKYTFSFFIHDKNFNENVWIHFCMDADKAIYFPRARL